MTKPSKRPLEFPRMGEVTVDSGSVWWREFRLILVMLGLVVLRRVAPPVGEGAHFRAFSVAWGQTVLGRRGYVKRR